MIRAAMIAAVVLMGCGNPADPGEDPEFKVKYKVCNKDRTVCKDTVL